MASETLFISDLHLAPDRPGSLALALAFLGGRARGADRLYILGDLFDAWIGDDDDSPFNLQVIQALRRLTDQGTPVDFMAGNRDFLIGRRFARATGCGLLPDPCLADLYGQRTLLTHGDLLCSDDRDYLRFRRRVRNPLVRWLFLLRGLERRRAIAANYRRLSQTAMADKPLGIMDANQDTICAYLRRYGSQRLIHGHTHRPAQHQFPLDGQTARRWVLADWRETSGEVLVVSAAGTQVETLT